MIHVLASLRSSELIELVRAQDCLETGNVKVQYSDSWLDDLSRHAWDIIMLDLSDGGVFGEIELQQLTAAALPPECEILVFSEGQSNELLDSWIADSGGFHFRKPWLANTLQEIISDIMSELNKPLLSASVPRTSDLDQFGLLLGSSLPMQRLYRLLRKVSRSNSSVLIAGESGSGKELVAQTIHQSSDRSDQPFVAINCGALSPELIESELFGHRKGAFTGAVRDHQGVFAQAEKGTLFLDEITEMPMEQQVKLLRVLETGSYRALGTSSDAQADVRIVAACNRVPEQAINEGNLREDLYYRLAQFPVAVPPLRERGMDIRALAEHFVLYLNAEQSTTRGISDAAFDKITSYSWPGNVRELKYAIERAYLLAADIIGPEHIEFEVASTDLVDPETVPVGIPLETIEQVVIEKTLEINDGNKTKSADQLGISVKTLYNKLDRYEQDD